MDDHSIEHIRRLKHENEHLQSEIRRLNGVIDRMVQLAGLRAPIDGWPKVARSGGVLAYLYAAADVVGVPWQAMPTQGKTGLMCTARSIAMTAARDAGHTTTDIGRWFQRDHSTCWTAIARFRKRLEREGESELAQMFEEVKGKGKESVQRPS